MRRPRPSAMSLTLWFECKDTRRALTPLSFISPKASRAQDWALRQSRSGYAGNGVGRQPSDDVRSDRASRMRETGRGRRVQ